MEGLKFDYYVNAEKKTVVCKMTVPENYVNCEIQNIIRKYRMEEYFLDWGNPVKVYRGISKCHPEDHFDEKIGKRIAKLRALMQFNKYKLGLLETVFNNISDMAIAIEAACDYAGCKYEDQDIELNELVDPEQDHYDDTNIVE